MSAIDQTVIKNCLLEIKKQLKVKGLSYTDLARHMDVSEVTVKRMLNQSDISFSRLMTIVSFIDGDLTELIQKAQAKSPKLKYFSKRQDQAFLKYPHLYQYYLKLIELNKSPSETAEYYKLNKVSNYLYLRALEDLELLTLLSDNKVQTPSTIFACSAESKFMKNTVARTLKKASSTVLENNYDNVHLSILFLPEKKYQELMEEINSLVIKFNNLQVGLNQIQNSNDPLYQTVLLSHPLKGGLNEIEVKNIKDGELQLL